MSEPLRLAFTLLLFGAVVLLVILRPRGIHEAWWTAGGAAIAVLFNLVSAGQVAGTMAETKDVLLFLLALLILAALIEASGFFDWAAIRAAELAHGDPRKLYRNMFLLGSAITATLSLDTTAVILTPVVVAAVQRLKLPARPYVLLCAFISNFASLLLPVSNLTNLLFAHAFHLDFLAYTARMILPQAAALAVTYAVFRRLHGRDLPGSFDAADLPEPGSVIRSAPYFRACRIALTAVLALYFAAPFFGFAPYVAGFAGCACLAAIGIRHRAIGAGIARHIAWAVFPFVIGLFVLVRALENCSEIGSGLQRLAADAASAGPGAAVGACIGTGILANGVNNLPAGLIAIDVLQRAHAPFTVLGGALVGANIGPGITVFGSLATILVIDSSRRRGVEVHASHVFRDGVIAAPLACIGAVIALVLEARFFR